MKRDWPVDPLLSFFKHTDNPIYAWECYRAARRSGKPVPEEVLVYFDTVSDGVMSVAENPQSPKRLPEATFRAMGFSSGVPGRGGSAFTHYNHDRLGLRADMDIAIETRREIKSWGKGHEHDVFVSIGDKYGLSASTVRRKYKDFWAWMDREVENQNK